MDKFSIPNKYIDKTETTIKYFGFEPAYIVQCSELIRIVYQFENGYGASLIQTPYSYSQGLWEIAVINPYRNLVYDTETGGFLSPDEIEPILTKILNLEKRKR